MGSSSRAARAVPVLAASLALPLTLATSTACSTYSVRKSALTPHIAPPMRSGFGLADAAAEASFGASTLATTNPPEEGPDANAGIHIPRLELGGALRGRLTDSLDLGFVWDQGLRQGAYKTSPDQPSPGGGSVYGGGASLFASIPTAEPSFRVGVGVDLMIYSIPFVEYRTCVENCGGKPYSTVDHDREEIGVYGLSLIPSWRSGRLTLFAGGTVRNHPTVAKGEIEGDIELDDEVRAGPVNLLVSGGAELELGAGVRAMGMVYQTLTDQPVRYWPTFAVGLTIPLGRRAPAPSPGRAGRRHRPRRIESRLIQVSPIVVTCRPVRCCSGTAAVFYRSRPSSPGAGLRRDGDDRDRLPIRWSAREFFRATGRRRIGSDPVCVSAHRFRTGWSRARE